MKEKIDITEDSLIAAPMFLSTLTAINKENKGNQMFFGKSIVNRNGQTFRFKNY
jgi:hypothetical protein